MKLVESGIEGLPWKAREMGIGQVRSFLASDWLARDTYKFGAEFFNHQAMRNGDEVTRGEITSILGLRAIIE
jgi:hypothetical protein